MWYQDKFIRRMIVATYLMAFLMALSVLWTFRFEYLGDFHHKNRITGAVCPVMVECWFSDD